MTHRGYRALLIGLLDPPLWSTQALCAGLLASEAKDACLLVFHVFPNTRQHTTKIKDKPTNTFTSIDYHPNKYQQHHTTQHTTHSTQGVSPRAR